MSDRSRTERVLDQDSGKTLGQNGHSVGFFGPGPACCRATSHGPEEHFLNVGDDGIRVVRREIIRNDDLEIIRILGEDTLQADFEIPSPPIVWYCDSDEWGTLVAGSLSKKFGSHEMGRLIDLRLASA